MISNVMDTKSFMNAARAAESLTKICRNLYDMPTGMEQRRFELEEKKVNAALRRDEDQQIQGGIIELPAVLPDEPDYAVEVDN